LDLIFVLLDEALYEPEVARRQTVILRQLDLGFHPEFGLAMPTVDMHVTPGFLAREEKEAEASLPENCRAHRGMLPNKTKGDLSTALLRRPETG
jgi:hypothetical protein